MDKLEKGLAVNIDTKAAELLASLEPLGKSNFNLTKDQEGLL
jgi:hypothetical protein